MDKVKACYRSQPTPYEKEVRTTSETAFQRALFNNGFSKTPIGEIEWLDLELPVDVERGGRGHCPDLLGRIGSRYVICELKFNNHSINNSPEAAAKEVHRYFETIKTNYVDLDKYDNIHRSNCKPFQWKSFAQDDVVLMVAADKGYWNYWKDQRNIELPKNVLCFSVDVSKDLFKEQKGNKESYIPSIPDIIWEKL